MRCVIMEVWTREALTLASTEEVTFQQKEGWIGVCQVDRIV